MIKDAGGQSLRCESRFIDLGSDLSVKTSARHGNLWTPLSLSFKKTTTIQTELRPVILH